MTGARNGWVSTRSRILGEKVIKYEQGRCSETFMRAGDESQPGFDGTGPVRGQEH